MLRYVKQKFDNLGIRRLTLEKYNRLARRGLIFETHDNIDFLDLRVRGVIHRVI